MFWKPYLDGTGIEHREISKEEVLKRINITLRKEKILNIKEKIGR